MKTLLLSLRGDQTSTQTPSGGSEAQGGVGVVLQLALGEDWGQRVPAGLRRGRPGVGRRVSHALLVRVRLLHVIPAVAVPGDLGEGTVLEGSEVS